jgi:hypothetical protein
MSQKDSPPTRKSDASVEGMLTGYLRMGVLMCVQKEPWKGKEPNVGNKDPERNVEEKKMKGTRAITYGTLAKN